MKADFDSSARKYLDWIDSIDGILEGKSGDQVKLSERQEIIREVKAKYSSYDEQFQNLLQTGQEITRHMQTTKIDSSEHESILKTLERRWKELHQQIRRYESDIEQSMTEEQFNEELKDLNRVRTEFQMWIDAVPSTTTIDDFQVKLRNFESFNDRLDNLRRMSDRFDTNAIQSTDGLLKSWDRTHSRLRERTIPVEHMQPSTSRVTGTSTVTTTYHSGTSSLPTSPNRGGTYEQTYTSSVGGTGGSSSAGGTGVITSSSGFGGISSTSGFGGISSTGGTGVITSSSGFGGISSTSGFGGISSTGAIGGISSTGGISGVSGIGGSSSSSSITKTTTSTSNINPSIGENGSVYTLTNIYIVAGDGNSATNLSDQFLPSSDKYNVKSYVEVFDQPNSQQESEYQRHYKETHSSSSVTRKIHTSATDTYDYDQNGTYDSSRTRHYYDSIVPSTSPRFTSDRTITTSRFSSSSYLSQLPTVFTDTHRKLRLWLEHVEQSLVNDKLRLSDLNAINTKRRIYKDLLDQAIEQERNLATLNELAREYYPKLSSEHSRQLQEELISYHHHLDDIKMFLSNCLAKCTRFEQTLSEFERSVEEVQTWIRRVQPRLSSTDIHGGSRALEDQLERNQVLQKEIRDMQVVLNRLNRDIVELTQNADENLARRLKDEMQRLNESWSQMISSTKIFSQNIQEALKRNRVIEEEIRELEDWIADRDRDVPIDDGSIFYQEQIRERLEKYQKLQNELSLKEHSVRYLVDQIRQDANQPSHIAENIVSNWSNLQKKIDTRVTYYTDLYRLHEELKDVLQRENIWLDQLQTKIYSTVSDGADAEEISEELDSLERFVKTHPRNNYERILDIVDRLQSLKVSISSTSSQINQFQLRWNQLHDDATKKLQALNTQITEYQQVGHEVTAMFEWMKHTDTLLNARLKDNVYADDVPAENDKLIVEFNQYEGFLRSVEDKIHTLRAVGKNEAARRLEQQYILLKNQFTQLQNKFRQFQKPSDFEPKYAQMHQTLLDVEHELRSLEVRSDDPDVIHNQLEHCSRLYKVLADIKPDVEYVIRVGRGIVEKGQTPESGNLIRQIDHLKSSYNNLGSKVSTLKNQLDSIERHLRKFRKEYTHVHEWFVRADQEIRKIENKQVSKNTKEEVDWIRTTRNDIRKMEANFETLRNLERSIQKDAERPLPGLHEKITELKRQIEQLDRRLRDRSDIVEGQVRRLDEEYRRFTHIYNDVIVRLEKLEHILSDAERVLDVHRITQAQDEFRSVRTQLDEILNLGQELVSKSEKYSRLVGPDIENITRKFEELQRRITTIQETQEKRTRDHQTTINTNTSSNNVLQDDQTDDVRREYFSEKRYQRTERETRQRSPSESSEISTAHGVIDEEFKKKYLRCLAYMKLIERLYDNQRESDEDSDVTHRRISRRDRPIRDRPEYEEIERIIRETEERAFVIEKTDVEQAQRIREKIRRLRDCLENLKQRSDHYEGNDEIIRYNERFSEHIRTTDRTVPRERELDSDFIYDVDDSRSVISEPAPVPNTKYRKTVHSLERYRGGEHGRYIPTQEEFQLQPLLRVRSLKAIDNRTLSAPSSPLLQPRYRSYERSNVQYTKQATNQQGFQDNYQSSISKSASMPNGGFPVHQNLLPYPPPPPPHFYPYGPMTYRERVIDKHVAERSTSRGESSRQQFQQSSGQIQQQQQQQQQSGGQIQQQQYHQQSGGQIHQQQQRHQQQVRSASASGHSQAVTHSIPVQYEGSSANAAAGSFRQTSGFAQETHPNYFYTEQQSGGGATSGSYRQQFQDQPVYSPQPVGRHPTRIFN